MKKLQLSVLSPSFSLSHEHTHPFSLRLRDVEEQWNLRRLILTLFYYSPSLASELSRISMGLHSLSWWKDSCAAESLFTPMPRPRSPLEYTTSPFTSMLTSEPSKINQKQTGASHLLISCLLALFETTCWIKKRPFLRLASMEIYMRWWHSGKRHRNYLLRCTPSSFCSFQSAWIFTSSPTMIQYDPLSECSFVLA